MSTCSLPTQCTALKSGGREAMAYICTSGAVASTYRLCKVRWHSFLAFIWRPGVSAERHANTNNFVKRPFLAGICCKEGWTLKYIARRRDHDHNQAVCTVHSTRAWWNHSALLVGATSLLSMSNICHHLLAVLNATYFTMSWWSSTDATRMLSLSAILTQHEMAHCQRKEAKIALLRSCTWHWYSRLIPADCPGLVQNIKCCTCM